MDDEAAAVAAEPTSAEVQTPVEQTERPDFDTVLSHLDSYLQDAPEYRQKLKSHRIVAGIAGDIAARQKQEAEQEAARKAIEQAHEEMRKLAHDDPVAFSERWLTVDQVNEARQREAGLRDMTRREFAESIGNALRDQPEFKELTEADVTRLTKAVTGVPEDKVLPAYVQAATDLLAEKRAERLFEAKHQTRLADEKKAWEAEQRANRLKSRVSPSLTPPSNGSAEDTGEPADMYSPEWSAWDQRQRKLGLGIYAARRRAS